MDTAKQASTSHAGRQARSASDGVTVPASSSSSSLGKGTSVSSVPATVGAGTASTSLLELPGAGGRVRRKSDNAAVGRKQSRGKTVLKRHYC